MKSGWFCELVNEATGEVLHETFSREAPISGPSGTPGLIWRATELAEADKVVHMTLTCRNIDTDRKGWFALRVDKQDCDKESVGRGVTAWEAVRNAHAGGWPQQPVRKEINHE